MTDFKHTNALINAQSPYLLQHAHNPVNWVEWNDAIFELAKADNKLIIVSIGYSACHWCHVMEHECFEDEETAQLMNDFFVCVKVDREEHPDVDQIYMDALQLLTGHGGWPLNMICLPDGRPIHGGTYFPKPDWQRVLTALHNLWVTKPDEAVEYATNLSNGVKKLDVFIAEPNARINATVVDESLVRLKNNFDLVLGGFTWAPKFPMPNNWQLILQYSFYSEDEIFIKAVNRTLTAMANGGIYDHLLGGFARYSTDSNWKVPHFEKMLYDNAQLIGLYSHAFAVMENPLYKKVVYETIKFIEHDLMNKEGLFFAALDADTEGVEGKFYVWTKAELQQCLGKDESLFSNYFSVTENGNWEHQLNVLHVTKALKEIEQETSLTAEEITRKIKTCIDLLLVERNKRTYPGIDDKTICSWNALAIKGITEAFMVFNEQRFFNLAKTAIDALLDKMYIDEKLFRIYKNNKVSIPAFAEDYALLIEALLKFYQASGQEEYLLKANVLMQQSIERFYDDEVKLFYFKNKNEQELITRKIDVNDDVISSANSVFANCLWQLGFYFSNNKYHHMVEEMVLLVQPKIKKFPNGFSNWMSLILLITKPYYQIVVTGNNADESYRQLAAHYLPNCILALVKTTSTIPLLEDKKPGNETLFYVCRDKTCGLPVNSVNEVIKQIDFL